MQKTKILFYDTEINSLNGLRRGLRSKRDQWQLFFASSPEEVGRILEQEKPLIFVADISDRLNRGIHLLKEAEQKVPGLIRIGISSETEDKKIFKNIQPTHQLLAKPFEIESLIRMLEGAISLQGKLDNSKLKEIIDKIEKLPGIPKAYYEIMDALNDEHHSLRDIGKVIEQDINTTGQLLKIVNSAYFGLFRNVTSVPHAVNLLGLNLVRNLVLGLSIFKGNQYGKPLDAAIEAIWKHSLLVAAFSRTMAQSDPDFADKHEFLFSAGILHDVGKLILLIAYRESYLTLLQKAKEQGIYSWELERREYGFDHTDAGGYLLGLWGLPDELVQVVIESHQFLAAHDKGKLPIAAILQCADALGQERKSDKSISFKDMLRPELLNMLEREGKLELWQTAAVDFINKGKSDE